mmetsp:Transcript_54885/g.177648  ORF Transcript_54885/g.177648 Transcript_54885/m.177648 type:complete len:137 (+) Transcript_54885:164-574(+)
MLNTTGGKIGCSRPVSLVRAKELHASSSFATRSASEKSIWKQTQFLDQGHSQNFAHNTTRRCDRGAEWSHGTSFAHGGVRDAKGPQVLYKRDVHTGAWHRDDVHIPVKIMPHPGIKVGKNLDMRALNSGSFALKLK